MPRISRTLEGVAKKKIKIGQNAYLMEKTTGGMVASTDIEFLVNTQGIIVPDKNGSGNRYRVVVLDGAIATEPVT